MFQFPVHPVQISVGDGIQMSLDYMRATWRRLLPVVLAYGIAQGFAYGYLIGNVNPFRIDQGAGGRPAQDQPGYWIGLALILAVSLVTSCIVSGVAIAGLRGRPVTVPWLVERGLRALGAMLLMGVLLVLAVTLLAVVLVAAVMAFRSLEIGIILYLVCMVAFVALAIRFAFVMYVAFDGAGPAEAIGESWRLSRGSVWRIFGWALLGGLIGGTASTAVSAATASIGSPAQLALAQGVGGAIAQTGGVFTSFMMAVLYESERARKSLGFDPRLPAAAPQAPPAPAPEAADAAGHGVSPPSAPIAHRQPLPAPVVRPAASLPSVPPVRKYADGSLPQDRPGTPDKPV